MHLAATATSVVCTQASCRKVCPANTFSKSLGTPSLYTCSILRQRPSRRTNCSSARQANAMASNSSDAASAKGLGLILPIVLLYSAYLVYGRLVEYWRLRHFKGPFTTGISWFVMSLYELHMRHTLTSYIYLKGGGIQERSSAGAHTSTTEMLPRNTVCGDARRRSEARMRSKTFRAHCESRSEPPDHKRC
jgi:hypothetical protein